MIRSRKIVLLCALILGSIICMGALVPIFGLQTASKTFINNGSVVLASPSATPTPNPTPTAAPPPTTGVSWLYTSGQNLYDQSGRQFKLFMPNFVIGSGNGITLADLQKLKSLGFNGIRVGVYWEAAEPNGPTVDNAIFTTGKAPLSGIGLDTIINWAQQQNMYVLFSVSTTGEFGVPSWAFPGVTDVSTRNANMFTGAAPRETQGLYNLYAAMASHYKNTANVIFELLNEPQVKTASIGGTPYANWNTAAISAMEAVETTRHIKIIELLMLNPAYTEILDQAIDVNKPNVIWCTHNYSPLNSWNPTGSYYRSSAYVWNGKTIAAGTGNGTQYVQWRSYLSATKVHSWNKPWISTEFSKSTSQTGYPIWFDATMKSMVQYNIVGWTIHCYNHAPSAEAGWNINDPTTQSRIMPLLKPYMVQP